MAVLPASGIVFNIQRFNPRWSWDLHHSVLKGYSPHCTCATIRKESGLTLKYNSIRSAVLAMGVRRFAAWGATVR
jgi:hypothetical protein